MATLSPLKPQTRAKAAKPVKESISNWRVGDRIAFFACWSAGLLLCAIAASITIFMLVKGLQELNWELVTSHPQVGLKQSETGGFLDPIIGTVLLTVIGITVATPLAVMTALWLVEYGRPRWLARIVESFIEIIAGTPSIVIAIFGLALFQNGLFAILSFRSDAGGVFGRSFVNAGLMMSFVALPLVFSATREGLQAVPAHVREASYGLGKTRIATIRRVLLPSVRSNISTGAALGMGRIAGDTAIVIVLLGATLSLEPEGSVPGANVLKGTGSTLTSYVYNNSPSGEGNAPQKAYAAAFVLLLIVVALNFIVDLIARRGSSTGLETQRLGA
ncbi:MAG: phosphate ABC transporter permease PstA [Solirubrobacterales bacterium]|nr:phosphate ABC transporter permease PstA [Solirubrobacterales bacterium]